MSAATEDGCLAHGQPADFATTHWSAVLAAGQDDSPRRAEALEFICRAYWGPLYGYIRRRGYDLPDAQDLTQEFFTRLLARSPFHELDPGKGKFRAFVLAALKNFLADVRDRSVAVKRGGGRALVSLDRQQAADFMFLDVPTQANPERAFDRHWALTVLDRAFQRLQAEFLAMGKSRQFDGLKEYLSREPDTGDYAAAAQKLGMTPNTVAVTVYRLRQSYRQMIRAEIGQTVASLPEVEEEFRYLIEIVTQ